jgi:hypothetical protein
MVQWNVLFKINVSRLDQGFHILPSTSMYYDYVVRPADDVKEGNSCYVV